MFEYQSEAHMPLSPYCFQVRLEAIKALSPVPREVCLGLPIESGTGWPLSLVNSGLGSNRSTWLGPPSMNSQITDFAVGGWCGFLSARGSGAEPVLAKPSSAIRFASAMPARPLPARVKNSRRLDTFQ